MPVVFPLLFPILGNLLGVYLVVRRKRRAVRTVLAVNLAASVLFGLFIAIKVFCCSAEPSLWPMPLVFATLEYWARFGVFVAVLAAILVAWSKWRASREHVSGDSAQP